jgi:fructose-1,6-bisphosphatase/inositol monophosphatase family enzyme
MIEHASELLTHLRAIHAAIRDRVVAMCEQQSITTLSEIVAEQAGDTIFALDRISEEVLIEQFSELGRERSFVLIAEGLGEDGIRTFPMGIDPADAELRIIIDPIDGTRGVMYQKRPAWILTGVARNRGSETCLQDIELALQTEIPLVKQHLCDCLWAIAEQGVSGERYDRLTGEHVPLHPQPSQVATVAYGYGGIARFFPGGRALLATIEDDVLFQLLGPGEEGKALAFEDQYICSGGQLYELLMGHDRWIADLRSLLDTYLHEQGRVFGLCAHPYDLCTELIAREAGLIITDERGSRLSAPLDVTSPVGWIGYANRRIFSLVAPVLRACMQQQGLLPPATSV